MTRNANIKLILEKTFEDHNEKKNWLNNKEYQQLRNKNRKMSFLAVLKQYNWLSVFIVIVLYIVQIYFNTHQLPLPTDSNFNQSGPLMQTVGCDLIKSPDSRKH